MELNVIAWNDPKEPQDWDMLRVPALQFSASLGRLEDACKRLNWGDVRDELITLRNLGTEAMKRHERSLA